MKPERRTATRKRVCPLTISHFSVVESMVKIAKKGFVVNASAKGFLVHIKREDLIPKVLKSNLNLEVLLGNGVIVKIEEMNLELFGRISRTKLLGKEGFELAIDYSEEAPLYWRECLMDLLPTPDEFSDFNPTENLISDDSAPKKISSNSNLQKNVISIKGVKSR